MTDAVTEAERLRADVADRIEKVLADAAVPPSDLYVGWVAALDAATCGARYRASGEDGWGFPGWSAPLAGGRVGRAALVRHLQVTARPSGTPPLPDPLEAVREWIRETLQQGSTTKLTEWVVERGRAGDKETLAATAAVATRWLSGFVRVLGWPLPDDLAMVNEDADRPGGVRWSNWHPPSAKGVTVASSPDAVLGKVTPTGGFALVVHRPSSPTDDPLLDRAAFEATAGALAKGFVAGEVHVLAADAGERARVPVDGALLERGATLIVEVVRQRVVAQGPWDFADATPSAGCTHCPALDRCPGGRRWHDNPARRHGGLPVLRG